MTARWGLLFVKIGVDSLLFVKSGARYYNSMLNAGPLFYFFIFYLSCGARHDLCLLSLRRRDIVDVAFFFFPFRLWSLWYASIDVLLEFVLNSGYGRFGLYL